MKKLSAVILSAAVMTGAFSLIPAAGIVNTPAAVVSYAVSVPNGLDYSVVSNDCIRLKWNKVKDADGYVVYEMNKSTGKWERITRIKNNYLTIKNIRSDTKYYYKVAAVIKKKDGKYYRGGFSDYIEVNIGKKINVGPNKAAQNEYLASYYKNNLSASKRNDPKIKSKAYIAPADVNGGEVMLVNYYYENNDVQTFLYGISEGKATPGVLIADSNEKNSSEAYFVKDEKSGEFYIFSSNSYSNSYEFRISRVIDGMMYTVCSANTIGDTLCYVNGEVTDYGIYLDIISTYTPFTDEDFEVDDSGEVYYLKTT